MGLFRDEPADEIGEELEFHLAERARELQERGMSAAEAREAARRAFGDERRVRAECERELRAQRQAERRRERLGELGQDVRFALRRFRRTPAATGAALVTLALGLCGSLSVFAIVRALLLEPLPLPHPEQLVRVWSAKPQVSLARGATSKLDLRDLQRAGAVAKLGAYSASIGGLVSRAGGEPVRLRTAVVDGSFFAALGARAQLGRLIDERDDVPGQRVVVLSARCFRRRFAADPRLVGQMLSLNDKPYTLIGVLPDELRLPDPEIELYEPLALVTDDEVGPSRAARWLSLVARLKPGQTIAQARAALSAALRALEAQHPDTNAGYSAMTVEPLHQTLVADATRPLELLFGAVLLVLLLACVNVAGLFLAAAGPRRQELAVRAALGADRARLVRLLLVESALVGLAGGALGLGAAALVLQAVRAHPSLPLPAFAEPRLDWALALGALGCALVAGLAAGVLPALRGTEGVLGAAIRETQGQSKQHGRLRELLVAVQVALAAALVIGSGLLVRSLVQLSSVDPGFQPERALVVRFVLQAEGASDRWIDDYERILARVRGLPGVVAAGAVKGDPLRAEGGVEDWPWARADRPPAPKGQEPHVEVRPASSGYLHAMGIPLLAGRDFDGSETDKSPPVGIASLRFFRTAFAGLDFGALPVEVLLAGSPVRIIGVAGDVKSDGLDQPAPESLYLPIRQFRRVHVALVVRTAGDPAALAGPVRAALREVVPTLPVRDLKSGDEIVGQSLARPRLMAEVLSAFGAVALLLSLVGLYGVLATLVAQRTREIGVRLALGAQPRDVLRLVLRRALLPVVPGLALGLAGALAASRLLASQLYGVSATDPATYAVVSALLIAAALLAGFLPARRAMRVPPSAALKAS